MAAYSQGDAETIGSASHRRSPDLQVRDLVQCLFRLAGWIFAASKGASTADGRRTRSGSPMAGRGWIAFEDERSCASDRQ